MSAFEELGICPEIIRAVEEDDWLLPTPVQQEAVPLILTGGDVCVAAETGSGKTGAFGLPCLQIVHEDLRGKCQTREAAGSNLLCTLSITDKDVAVRVGEAGLECRSDDKKRWTGVRASMGVCKGKYMYEVEAGEGLIRVGWSVDFADLELGTSDRSFGYGSTGKKSSGKKYEDYGEAFEDGDVIGCLLDREKRTVSYFKNGRDLGVAFTLPEELDGVLLKPHICGKGFVAVARFDGPMEYKLEQYTPLGEADPEHCSKGAAAIGKRPPMCMILEPTRDLAEQTYQCMSKFSKYLEDPPVRVARFVGGMDDGEQLRALERGVDIYVGTLMKTMDLIRRGALDVSHVKFLVLDEADDLLKKDDKKDLSQLNAEIKKSRRDRVQTLFFSATLHSPEVTDAISEITSRPTWVDLKGKDAVPDTVHHVVYHIDPAQEMRWTDEEIAERAKFPNEQPILDGVHKNPSMSDFDKDKADALRKSQRVKQLKPKMLVKIADLFKMSQCLVFVRTNIDCNNLEAYLNHLDGSKSFRGKFESGKENPYSCAVLSGSRTQKEREKNLAAFKEGDVRFLICTDVAARGIDISGLPFVVQMNIPDDIENYVHRIGRCGRAEHMGLAIAIASTAREKVWYFKNKQKNPSNGSTKLTVPFAANGELRQASEAKWIVEEGGDCTWHDEPDLLQQVEKRIGQELTVLDSEDFSVPGVLESPLPEHLRKKGDDDVEMEPLSRQARKRKRDSSSGPSKAMVYGSKKNDKTSALTSQYMSAMAPVVLHLAKLEKSVQMMFTRAMWGDLTVRGMADESAGPGNVGVRLSENPAPSGAAAGAAAPMAVDVDGSERPKTKKKVRW